jgi:hypothetical protein
VTSITPARHRGCSPKLNIVSYYTQRWTIEVTFQKVRAHLEFDTPLQRVANSVQRMAPLLLGLFSLVTLIYHQHCLLSGSPPASRPWYDKAEPAFSDALEFVRRLLWTETVFHRGPLAPAFEKNPLKLKNTLLNILCQAAWQIMDRQKSSVEADKELNAKGTRQVA